MKRKINLTGQKTKTKISKADAYKVEIGDEFKTLSLGETKLFNNSDEKALYVEPISSRSGTAFIIVEEDSIGNIIVISTIADLEELVSAEKRDNKM